MIRATVDLAKGSVLLQHREDQPEGGYSTVRVDEVGSGVRNQRDAEAALKNTKWRIVSHWHITQGQSPWVAVEPERIPSAHLWDKQEKNWTDREWGVLSAYGRWLTTLSPNEWGHHISRVEYAGRWETVPAALHAYMAGPRTSSDTAAHVWGMLRDIRLSEQMQRDREIGYDPEDDWTFGGHWR